MDMSSEADTSIKLDVLKLDRLSDPQPSPHSHRILSTAFKVLSRGCRGFANLLHREKDASSIFLHVSAIMDDESMAAQYAIDKTIEVKSKSHPHLNQALKDFVPDFERNFRIPISKLNGTRMHGTVSVSKVVHDAIKIGNIHSRSISGVTMVNTPTASSPTDAQFPHYVQDSNLSALADKLIHKKVGGLWNDTTKECNEQLFLDLANGATGVSVAEPTKDSVKAEIAQKDMLIHNLEKKLQNVTSKNEGLQTQLRKKSEDLQFLKIATQDSESDEIKAQKKAIQSKDLALNDLHEEMKELQWENHQFKDRLQSQTENVREARAEIVRLNSINVENSRAESELLSQVNAKQVLIERLEASVKATHERVTHGTTGSSTNTLRMELDETKEKLAASEKAYDEAANEMQSMQRSYDLTLKEQKEYWETKLKNALQNAKSSWEKKAAKYDKTMKANVNARLKKVADDQRKASRAYEGSLLSFKHWLDYYGTLGRKLVSRAVAIQDYLEDEGYEAYIEDLNVLEEAKSVFVGPEDIRPATLDQGFVLEVENATVDEASSIIRPDLEVKSEFEQEDGYRKTECHPVNEATAVAFSTLDGIFTECDEEDAAAIELAAELFNEAHSNKPSAGCGASSDTLPDSNASMLWGILKSECEWKQEDTVTVDESHPATAVQAKTIFTINTPTAESGNGNASLTEVAAGDPLTEIRAISHTFPDCNASNLWGILESHWEMLLEVPFEHSQNHSASIMMPQCSVPMKDDVPPAVEQGLEVIEKPSTGSNTDSSSPPLSSASILWGILEPEPEWKQWGVPKSLPVTYDNGQELTKVENQPLVDEASGCTPIEHIRTEGTPAVPVFEAASQSSVLSIESINQGSSRHPPLATQNNFEMHINHEIDTASTPVSPACSIDISFADTSANPFAAKASPPSKNSEDARRAMIEESVRKALALRKAKQEREVAKKAEAGGARVSRQERRKAERRAEKERKKMERRKEMR